MKFKGSWNTTSGGLNLQKNLQIFVRNAKILRTQVLTKVKDTCKMTYGGLAEREGLEVTDV